MADAATLEVNVEQVLTETGVTAEQIKKLMDAGLVMPKPQKLEDLPAEMKALVQQAVAAETQKERNIVREQLKSTLDTYKSKIENVETLLKEREAAVRAEEEAKRQALLAEQSKGLPIEAKLEQLKRESEEALKKLRDDYETKNRELALNLRKTQLSSIREKLILSSGGEVIPELVIDPEMFPTATEEDIKRSFELSQQKYRTLHENFVQKQTQLASAQAEEARRRGETAQEVEAGAGSGEPLSLVEKLFGKTSGFTGGTQVLSSGPIQVAGKSSNISSSVGGQSSAPDVKKMSLDQLQKYRAELESKLGVS